MCMKLSNTNGLGVGTCWQQIQFESGIADSVDGVCFCCRLQCERSFSKMKLIMTYLINDGK